MLGARARDGARERERRAGRRENWRTVALDRRAWIALAGALGVAFAISSGYVDVGSTSGGWAARGGVGATSDGRARVDAREGVGARVGVSDGDLGTARSADFGAYDGNSDVGRGIDVDALNEHLSGTVWDFNEPRPRAIEETMGKVARSSRLLPSLGQTSQRSQSAKNVAEGESRGSKDDKDRDGRTKSKAGTLQPGLALSDDEIYDPAFVDDDFENGRRSAKQYLKRFLDPPLLNTTWDTGRVRRLGRTLYLDGKPWLMRAICYSPVPIGWDPDWFEPYGDFFTNEYAGIFERDVPLMAAAGVNTLRIYTLKLSKRHKQFFDLVHQYNMTILVGYDFEDGTKSLFNTAETMQQTQKELRTLVRAAKHPAVIGWIVGNELNGPWNLFVCDKDLAENFGVSGCQFEDSIEKLMKSVNMLCGVVRSENMLCGTAIANVNLPKRKQHLVGTQLWGALSWIKLADRYMDQLDFWGVNLYTRRYFSPMGIFQRYHLVSKRPFLITEFGVDAFSLAPQLEGSNGYDTMGTEDEVSQADWLATMVEDIERHSTTCKAGCGVRFTSGGAVLSWVDEYWKGKAVTPVPTNDDRVPTITRVCPSLKEYLHSPCGYMSPTQPDLYVSEEWFGIMAIRKKCSINKVDLLRPRAAYYMLKLLWKDGGSCTIFHEQTTSAYDTDMYPDCSKAMKNYHNKTMHLFMRAEAEAWHGIKLNMNDPTPIFAHFENFSAILTHPKGLINPVSTSLQSTFMSCHHMKQINRKSDKTCPSPPVAFGDLGKIFNDQMSAFEQPGDTSCPDQEQFDAMKLEVELVVVIKFAITLYLAVALAIRWRFTRRHVRDALISLSRSNLFIVRLFIKDTRAFVEVHKRAERVLGSPAKTSRQLDGDLSSESSEQDDELSLRRRGPEPSGSSSIERGIEQWRARISPAAMSLSDIFGFQAGTEEMGSTRENCIDKCAHTLWNTSQLKDAPSNASDWAVETLHSKTFAAYKKYIRYTGINFSPRGVSTLASSMSNGNTDDKLCQIVLFELLYEESANMRYMPEFMMFTFHLMAAAVINRGVNCSAAPESGVGYEKNDFLTSIATPMYEFLTLHMKSAAPLHLRLGYDDINEAFIDIATIRTMLSMDAKIGTSSYARFRQFMLAAGSATEKDKSLSAVFKKTYREHLGWLTAYINFQRMFTLFSLLLHAMIVFAFVKFSQLALYSTMAVTVAFFDAIIELRVLFFDRVELFHSRLESIGRGAFALVILLLGSGLSLGYVNGSVFSLIGSPYLLLSLANILGYQLTSPRGSDDYFTKEVGRSVSSKEHREHVIFWLLVFVLKLPLDYVLMIRPLVVPTKAILSIDLYCWNYNFGGADCDAYEYNELFSPRITELIRLSRRHGLRSLMLFERWIPNILLYFGNTFFYFLFVLGLRSAMKQIRTSGVAGGWSQTVISLPKVVGIFADKVLTNSHKPTTAPDPATALCAEAISESWRSFARAWNEIIHSIRSRDLLSNDETNLLLFKILNGRASESFFGSHYVMFPIMLTGSIFSGIGLQRNEKMRFDFSAAVMAQMADLVAFIVVCILGVVDASDRVIFVELMNSLTELLSLGIAEHSETILWLTTMRSKFAELVQSLRSASTDLSQVSAQIEQIFVFITSEIAQDRESEHATHKRTNALIVETCARLQKLMHLDRLESTSSRVMAAASSRAGSSVLGQISLMLSTANPAGEPSAQEAKDILRFFVRSMDRALPNAMTVRQMPMLTTLTPVYAEEIRTSLDTLTQNIDGESVTGFRFMISMAPSSWENMIERTQVKVQDSNYEHFFDRALLERNTALSTFTDEEKRFAQESVNWASLEGQTLHRTVTGFACYADALRIFARMEGVAEEDIEPLVQAKFEHVVCAQVYQAPGYTMNEEIESIVETFPHVKVSYVMQPNAEDPNYAIGRIERGTDGKFKQTHRVQIPGHPIVGEGKPENQNLGLVWARGNYIQTIDMNQDANLAEGMKMRNLLSLYQSNDDLVLIGFNERLISGRQGSVSSFAAVSETVFGTMLQHFMANPLRVRLHYGHPDVWDGAFVRSCGGVSKATRKLHLSEDVYGGMNVLQRGGIIDHVAFISCGKGREVSFDGNNQFNKKIATGNGMQLLSRDFYRLARSMGILRCMSFFQSSVGMFYTEFLLFNSMFAFVLCKTMICMYQIETYFKQGDAFDNVGFHQEVGIETLYPSQWMLQASLVMAWPGMLHGWINGGLLDMIKDTYNGLISGSFVYHMFIAKSRGYSIDASITSGDAVYRGTKRSMHMNASFTDLYMQYAASHILPSFTIVALTVLLTALSRFGPLYVLITTTWHVWLAVSMWVFSPWIFHPQTFKEGSPAVNFTSWLFWLDNRKHISQAHSKDGAWLTWHTKQMRSLRAMPRHLKIEYIAFRIVPLPALLFLSAMVAITADDSSATAPLRGVVVFTSGVAGVLLAGVYYMSTSPVFLWPQRVVALCEKLRVVRGEVDRRILILLYNMTIRVFLLVFHIQLCERLFSQTVDTNLRQNKVIFVMCGCCALYCVVSVSSIIGDNPLAAFRGLAFSLRAFSDFCYRDIDEVVGLILHVAIATLALAPISYVHAKTLFNRAYASVLALEMRRSALVVTLNNKITSKSLRNWFLSSRSFIRRVLGLKTAPVRSLRQAPSTIPDLMIDLTKVGEMTVTNERVTEIKRRVQPIASHLADLFGFQKAAKDRTFTSETVEVPSNLWNSVEALSSWLENLLTQREDVDSYSLDHLNRYWIDVVNELHAHLFQNYNRWGAFTGMVDAVSAHARRVAATMGDDAALPLSLYMSDANELWTRTSREHTTLIELNAKLHHLCLWFLIYGESANLRHMSECLCFIFHSALCAVKLERRVPNEGEEHVLCKPVAEEVMPYAEKDYLRTIVTPIFLFLKREISDRSSEPVSDRVMYDDVNEFFWRYDRLVKLLPPDKEPVRSEGDADFVGVPAQMAGLSRDERMYEHLRSFMRRVNDSGDPANELSGIFIKTHRECSGWLSMFVNFHSIILFHAVAFHVSTAYVFGHGWNWSYICTATLTHALFKFTTELAMLRFVNLSQERFGDWMVTATRAGMFLTMPLFYALEYSLRSDYATPYFEGLATVYTIANSGLMSNVLRRTTFVGSPVQMAPPYRERIIYTSFWIVVLGTKIVFGHFLLISPLREAVSALRKGDLCWNKESDEYTSCINLEGDALVQALKFVPKITYFTEKDEDEEDEYKDLDLGDYQPLPERRRSLLSSHAGGGDFTGASWGDVSQFAIDSEVNESADPYNGQFRGWSSIAASPTPMPRSPLESVVSSAADAIQEVIGSKKFRLPALGYIGEEIEGQLPEAYYDVHASQFLMTVMVIARMLPAIATYFCDTFLWYTCYASLFTIFLQWQGKVSHAQRWGKFIRGFSQIPSMFCEKVMNKTWPKPVAIDGDFTADDRGVNDDNEETFRAKEVRQRSGGGIYGNELNENLLDAVALAVIDEEMIVDSNVQTFASQPAHFLPEAMDIKWQHFARGWNSIVDSLRARDQITNKESVDMKFVFLQGRDVEQIFDAPEYIILAPMLTSSVFSQVSFRAGSMEQYPWFGSTLIQTKDLICVIMTEVLRVVSPGDLTLLMRVVSDLASLEKEHVCHRRHDDMDAYSQLRDAIIKLLLTLQVMGSSTDATPIVEDQDENDDEMSESDDDDDEEAQLFLLGDQAGAERARLRKEQRRKRRQLKAIREKERMRQKQVVEAINLEMKFGCTGIIPKETRKKMKEGKSGLLRGCFVVQENWEELTEEQHALLQGDEDKTSVRKRWRRGRRKLIKWSNIQTDADIEAQSNTLAEALHDILLAVRKICAFAMESDGKWSNTSNQRKYRVAQLYSQLLEMVRIDALRDGEHVRVVSASATLPTNRQIVNSLLNSMNNSNPGGEPRNPEARRQLMFFTNSLNFTSLKMPTKLRNMRGWTAFTPYYAEEVSYSKDELVKPLEDQKTLFSIIRATYPDEYENFKERIGALAYDDARIFEQHWDELRVWASDRTQSLSRCVRGICYYGTALRFLARLEGYEEAEIEMLVQDKFEYLVSCQVYGNMLNAPLGSENRRKAGDIDELILSHPELRVCFVQVKSERDAEFASCLVGCDRESRVLSMACKVELPGNPIIGEGKPENQNHAVIFSRGAYLQTLDMNQDGYFPEALKMRNLLDTFSEDVVLVGFPEVIFSETTGAVAQFAAISEFIFQTFQRFMTWPLMVRFHYGHPDVWDKAFTMTNGGVSKASKVLHVAEDFFGGVNAICRGGRVLFEEFIEVGKGRDMGFTSVNGFEQKISGSAGTISMSRDVYRLHRSMDMFRMMSMYFSGPGFFISVMQTAWCVYLYILVHAGLAIADLEIYRVYRYFKMTEAQTTLSLSKEEGGYYNSIYAIQLGLLTVLPLFLKMIMDRGLRDGFEYTASSLLRGSWAFNIFAMTTKGYNYMIGLLFGKAQYIATERGFVLNNANMVVLYGLYAKSHLYTGMEVLCLLLLFHCNTVLPKSILYSWSVWSFALCILMTPWWFSPQSTNAYWMQKSWMDWRRWLDGSFDQPRVANGSWRSWHDSMIANYRNRIGIFNKCGVLIMSSFGRIMLALVITGSLHGTALYSGTTQTEQFYINVSRMASATAVTGSVAFLYMYAMNSVFFVREPWLKFPDKLWKISFYRGLVRLGLFLIWNGLYFYALHVDTGNYSMRRTWFMTGLGSTAVTSLIIEACVMLSDRTVTSFGERFLPIQTADGEAEPRLNALRRIASPFVYGARRKLLQARDAADFWYKELDKLMGCIIFMMISILSLFPVTTMQTALIWNETFSDILAKRVTVQETVSSILD